LSSTWTGTQLIVWNGDRMLEYEPGKGWAQPFPVPNLYPDYIVWTGSEILAWGFSNTTGAAEGYRVNITTKTIRPMSKVGSPRSDLGNSTIWTGTRMIVFGGINTSSNQAYATGASYDPVTDKWEPIAPAPFVRVLHTAVWDGQRMIVFGGQRDGASIVHAYSPAANTWQIVNVSGGTPPAIAFHGAVWTGKQMIVWGGQLSAEPTNNSRRNSGLVFDTGPASTPAPQPAPAPALPTLVSNLQSINAPPEGRFAHAAVWANNSMILLGGYKPTAGAPGQFTPNYLSNLYDATSARWATTAIVAEPPVSWLGYKTPAVWTGEKVILWSMTELLEYDPVKGTSLIMTVPSLEPAAIVWTGTHIIGWGSNSKRTELNGYRVDIKNKTVAPISKVGAPANALWHTAVWTGTVMIVWGGSDLVNSGTLNTGGIYDPATNTWKKITAPVARGGHSAVWNGQRMIIHGGWDTAMRSDTYAYDPANNTWQELKPAGAVPPTRAMHTAIWTGRAMIVWGGVRNGDLTGAFNSGLVFE